MGRMPEGDTTSERVGRLENGWLLPSHVRVREDQDSELETRSDQRRSAAAYLGLGMNGLALAASVAGWGIPHKDNALSIVFPLAVALLPLNVVIVGFCRRSLRSAIPRPTLDRPASLVRFVMYAPVAVLIFGLAGVLTSPYSWNWAAVIGAIALGVSVIANFWWAAETGHRWNLAYEVVKL